MAEEQNYIKISDLNCMLYELCKSIDCKECPFEVEEYFCGIRRGILKLPSTDIIIIDDTLVPKGFIADNWYRENFVEVER